MDLFHRYIEDLAPNTNLAFAGLTALLILNCPEVGIDVDDVHRKQMRLDAITTRQKSQAEIAVTLCSVRPLINSLSARR
jgi:hypothetical protein